MSKISDLLAANMKREKNYSWYVVASDKSIKTFKIHEGAESYAKSLKLKALHIVSFGRDDIDDPEEALRVFSENN